MAKTIITLVLRAKDEVSNILKSTAAKVTALIAAFGGAAAIKNTVSNLSELDTMARRLNVSLDDLTAAQYAAFSGAGVNPDQFVDAIEDMRIKIEEFRALGSGGAADFFEVLNEDVEEFARLNPLEQLDKIAKAMDGLSDTQAFTFLDQLGSDNLRRLAPLLREGGKEFDALKQKARDLGVTLNDENAIGMTAVATSFNNIRQTISRSFDRFISTYAPEMVGILDTISDAISGVGRSADDSFGQTDSTLNKVILATFAFGSALERVFGFVKMSSGMIAAGLTGIVDGLIAIINGFGKAGYTVLNGLGTLINGITSQIMKAISLYAKGINSLIKLIPGVPKSFTQAIDNFAKTVEERGNNLAKKFFNVEYEGIDRSNIKKKGMEFAQLYNDGVDQMAGKDLSMDKFAQKYIDSRQKALQDIEEESSKRGTSSGDGELRALQEKNAKAAATILETRAKLASDIAKIEINEAIARIDSVSSIELAGLQARARAENLTTNQIADERFRIEMESSKRIAAERKKLVDEDIKALQAQVAAQEKIMSAEAKSGERELIAAEIVKLESEIALKQQEQTVIGAELIRQQALMRAERAAEKDELLEQLDQIREDAEIELKIMRGDTVGAELDQIERDFADTLRELEKMGQDSTAVQELVAAKKARAELNQVERDFDNLKRRLQDKKISPSDYMDETNRLEQKGLGLAQNDQEKQDVEDKAEELRVEIFSMKAIAEEISVTLSDGLTDVFVNFVAGSKSAKQAFSEFANSMLQDLTKIIAKMMVQYALQVAMGGISGGGGGGGGFSGLMGSIGLNHSGGLLGESGISRSGSVGLRSDEALIIGRKGEEVLTETNPRHAKNFKEGQGASSGGKVTVNNMIDSPSIAKAMEGSDGERVIMNVIRANRGEIKSM